MDRPFEFNGIKVKTPDTFKPNLATTSTEDSDRTEDLVMHNTPMGTIESYSFEWKYIEPEEAAKIISQTLNKRNFSLRYLSFVSGKWETGQFYASNYNPGSLRISNGKEKWESLSFNVVGVYPV